MPKTSAPIIAKVRERNKLSPLNSFIKDANFIPIPVESIAPTNIEITTIAINSFAPCVPPLITEFNNLTGFFLISGFIKLKTSIEITA